LLLPSHFEKGLVKEKGRVRSRTPIVVQEPTFTFKTHCFWLYWFNVQFCNTIWGLFLWVILWKIFPQWFINLCYFIVLCIEWTCQDVEYIGMMSISIQAMLWYYLDNIASMCDKTCKALGHFLTLGGMSFIKWNFPIEWGVFFILMCHVLVICQTMQPFLTKLSFTSWSHQMIIHQPIIW